MKKADMVIGDEYAVSQSQSGWGYGIQRVQIVATGVERTIRSRYPNRKNNDGVEVIYLVEETGLVRDLSAVKSRYSYPELIRAQNVKATWDDYLEHLAAVKANAAKRAADVKDETVRLGILAAAANAVLGANLIKVTKGYSMPFLEGSIDAIARCLADTHKT